MFGPVWTQFAPRSTVNSLDLTIDPSCPPTTRARRPANGLPRGVEARSRTRPGPSAVVDTCCNHTNLEVRQREVEVPRLQVNAASSDVLLGQVVGPGIKNIVAPRALPASPLVRAITMKNPAPSAPVMRRFVPGPLLASTRQGVVALCVRHDRTEPGCWLRSEPSQDRCEPCERRLDSHRSLAPERPAVLSSCGSIS
jgi:hypothetical protein